MEPELLIIKPAESFLKSGPVRGRFEKRLRYNIKMCLKQNDILYDNMDAVPPRTLLYTDEIDEAAQTIKNVFGISSIHFAVQIGANFEAMNEAAYDMSKSAGLTKNKTFAVRARRVTKDFPLNSVEIAAKVGGYIASKTKAKVKLKNPDIEISLEVMNNKAFLFTKTIKGLGGLPLGVSGNVACLMSASKESILAAWLIMKRGCEICPLHLRTNDKDQQKYLNNINILNKFACGSNIRASREKLENKATQIKEFMQKNNCKALVTEHIEFTSELKELHEQLDAPVFSPLMGKTKKELKALGELIFV